LTGEGDSSLPEAELPSFWGTGPQHRYQGKLAIHLTSNRGYSGTRLKNFSVLYNKTTPVMSHSEYELENQH